MKKGTLDTRRVNTPARQRLATSRKRTLRSQSGGWHEAYGAGIEAVMIEPRNFDGCWSLADRVRRGSTDLYDMAMNELVRPGSESGAEIRVGIPGTCDSLTFPEEKSRNGMQPSEQRPGLSSVLSQAAEAKQGRAPGYWPPSSRRGCREDDSGSLSQSIVAFKSRVTLLGRSL